MLEDHDSPLTPRVRLFVVDADERARARTLRVLRDGGLWINGDADRLAELAVKFPEALNDRPAVLVLDPDPPPGAAPDEESVFPAGATLPPTIACLLHSVGRDRERLLAWLRRGVVDYVDKAACRGDELLRVTRRLLRRLTDPAATDHPTAWVAGDQLPFGWVELTAPSAPECLSRIGKLANALAAREWPPELRADLLAAIEEAGTNAMEWGNRLDPGKRIHLSFALFDDRIVLKCVDEGEGFRPGEVPDPWRAPDAARAWRAARNKRPGGRGLPLLYMVMDEVVYSEKGNAVVMTKWLPAK